MSRKLKLSSEAVEFICGFCGRHCIADMPNKLVSHSMPMCPQFEKLEPDQFLYESRLEHERKGTNPTDGTKPN